MNWITISVALTVLVCISFDNGYVASQDTNATTTPATADNSQSSDGDNGPGTDNSGDGGTVDSTNVDDGGTDQTGTNDKANNGTGTNNANSGTTETNNANSGTTETNNDGNSGSGAGELSAKVLMIATMAGCTLAVYGGL